MSGDVTIATGAAVGADEGSSAAVEAALAAGTGVVAIGGAAVDDPVVAALAEEGGNVDGRASTRIDTATPAATAMIAAAATYTRRADWTRALGVVEC